MRVWALDLTAWLGRCFYTELSVFSPGHLLQLNMLCLSNWTLGQLRHMCPDSFLLTYHPKGLPSLSSVSNFFFFFLVFTVGERPCHVRQDVWHLLRSRVSDWICWITLWSVTELSKNNPNVLNTSLNLVNEVERSHLKTMAWKMLKNIHSCHDSLKFFWCTGQRNFTWSRAVQISHCYSHVKHKMG